MFLNLETWMFEIPNLLISKVGHNSYQIKALLCILYYDMIWINKIPMTNGDRVRYFCSGKMYQTLLEFEPATPQPWSKHVTTALLSRQYDKYIFTQKNIWTRKSDIEKLFTATIMLVTISADNFTRFKLASFFRCDDLHRWNDTVWFVLGQLGLQHGDVLQNLPTF